MASAKFQLNLQFANRGPESAEGLMIAEALLREELKLGQVEGNDVADSGADLFIVTAQPQECLRAAVQLLHSIQVLPIAASYQVLAHDAQGRAAPTGAKIPLPIA
jgi:hypothetical protein